MVQINDRSEIPRLVFGFRSRNYSEQEQRLLSAAVGSEFEIKLKPFEMPEAGGTAEIWAFLQSPQGWFVNMLLGNLAYDAMKKLGYRLAGWFREYKTRNTIGLSPHLVSFTISIHGVQYEIFDGHNVSLPYDYSMTDIHLEHLSVIVRRMVELLPPDILRKKQIKTAKVPVFASTQIPNQDSWFFARYWTMTATNGSEWLFDKLNRVYGPSPIKPFKSIEQESAGP